MILVSSHGLMDSGKVHVCLRKAVTWNSRRYKLVSCSEFSFSCKILSDRIDIDSLAQFFMISIDFLFPFLYRQPQS